MGDLEKWLHHDDGCKFWDIAVCTCGLSAALDAAEARDVGVKPLDDVQQIRVNYTNYRGETADRTIIPVGIYFGETDWHPGKQWLMNAWDVDKQAMRDFALCDMRPLHPASPLGAVATLVEAVERLNAACDAMWNDYERLGENPHHLGQPWQLKDVHVRAISEAQQCLPAALAPFARKGG